MKLLAIDTAGKSASAAVLVDSALLAEYTLQHNMTHSEALMPMVAELLEKTEVLPQDLDAVACTQGPGSFTGLRIGAATAKGLAHALGIPVVPVPTLDALAYTVLHTDAVICPIMDARRQQVYTAFYRWENGLLCRIGIQDARPLTDVLEEAEGFGQPVVFLGDAVPVYRKLLQEKAFAVLAPPVTYLTRASNVGALAEVYWEKRVPAHQFAPVYLRKPQAEREREERKGVPGV